MTLHRYSSESSLAFDTKLLRFSEVLSCCGIFIRYYWNRDNVSKMRSKVLAELLACSTEDRSERVLDLCILPLRNCSETHSILDNDEAIQHLNRIMSAEQWGSRLDLSSSMCLTSEERTYFKSIARHKKYGS